MSAPAGIDDQVRRSAISFRQQNGANTLTAFDVQQKLTAIIPTLNTLSDQEVNRLSRLFEETYANPPPAGSGGFKRKSQTERFSRCVKMVRKTVTPRRGSNKESAAIAICTKTILHKRGRTIKRYSKKRLVTQRRK